MTDNVSTASSVELTGTVLRDEEQLQLLLPEWGDLFSRSGCTNVFLSAEWMHEWWVHYAKGRSPFLIALRNSAQRLVAIAPFCLGPAHPKLHAFRELRFFASWGVSSDHLDLLIEHDLEASAARQTAGILLEHRHEWDVLILDDYDSDSKTMIEFRLGLRLAGLRERVMDRKICPYIPLPESFDTLLAGLNSNWRRNFRHGLRMLEVAAPFHLWTLTDPTSIQQRFREAMNLHHSRFSVRREESRFLDEAQQAFHAGVIPRLAARGWVRLYLLEVGDHVVAAYYGYSMSDRFLAFQSGIDPSWSRFSVGLIIVGLAIRESIRDGHVEFDFLRGSERYKFHWTKRTRETLNSRFFNSGLAGSTLFLVAGLFTKWAAVRHQLRLRIEKHPAINRLARRLLAIQN